MASFLEKILRTGDKKILKQLEEYTKAVNSLEDSFASLTDAELRAETDSFRERLEDGESLDILLPEAFAVVREASKRTLGKRHYDVQIMGGAALHLGNIAEMKTGEGKTLVATLPAYLNALSGKGVHVVTVNDYLAEYQANLMGRVYRFLGMESGVILSSMDSEERRKQYEADITYGTNNEFGFDYLRDNMAWTAEEQVQRGHNFAIVDEVDSILIDEARTPLIISGPAAGEANRWYAEFARIAKTTLKKGEDYEVDEKKRTVGILESGIDKVEDHLGVKNLYESKNTPLIGFLNNSIKAKELFTNDKDYVVVDGEVLIVDEHTGRVLPGRRYNEGMHQAIEAKERVEIKAENQTLATITLQNYFRLYPEGSRSGMTGTAETEAAEFAGTYKIGVVPIPTNKPMIREDQPDLVYTTVEAKLDAVVDDIAERHEVGQPVLVGTTSVEKSETLSERLRERGIPHEVLNAKQHAREAAVVAMAGRKGAVTVATNMAGRGTDIMLGGNAEHIAVTALKEQGLDPEENTEEYERAWPAALAAAKTVIITAPVVLMQVMVLALTWLVGAALGLGPVPPTSFAVECLIAVPAAQPLIAVQSLLSMRMRSFAAPVAVCFGGIVVGVALVLKGGALANAWPQSLVTRALTLGSQTLGTVGALDASGLVALLAGTAVCGAVCWGLLVLVARRRGGAL